MNRIPSHTLNSAVRREPDRRALVRLCVVFVCGLLLTLGFVRAAAQHTAALEQGYRSEELRKERERLLSEQRRLMLELTTAQSPVQLEQRAPAPFELQAGCERRHGTSIQLATLVQTRAVVTGIAHGAAPIESRPGPIHCVGARRRPRRQA